MNNLMTANQTFSFEDTSVRVSGSADEPLFCLVDVCKILALQNPTHAVNQIKEEFELPTLNVASFDTGFGIKEFTMITEPQLYFVLLRSRSDKAKPFRKWVTTEVLPEIRKTGSYHSPKTYLEALKELVKAEEEKQKLALENKTMKPKADYFDDLVDRKTLTNFRDTAKELHLQPKAFISLLLEKGFIYRDAKGKIKPYANYSEYFHIKEAKGFLNCWSGVQTLITPKGREAFRILLLKA